MRYNLILVIIMLAVASSGCKKEIEDICTPPPPETIWFRLVDSVSGKDAFKKYYTVADTIVGIEACSGKKLKGNVEWNKDSTGDTLYFFSWSYLPSVRQDRCRTIYLKTSETDIDTIEFSGIAHISSGNSNGCDVDNFRTEKIYFNGKQLEFKEEMIKTNMVGHYMKYFLLPK